MQTYKAIINVFPGQAMQHSFPKKGLTAPEVMLLRHIHGDEAIKDLKADTAEASLSLKQERERLEIMYGLKAVHEMFGPAAASRLPEELAEIDTFAAMEENSGYKVGKNQKVAA